MNIKNIYKGLLILLLPFLNQNVAFGQEAALPIDPSVKTGTLKNGFRYFIKRNVEPAGRATMYLANKVGSILETEQERGLAHFIEHMNFNGTKHFPKNELISYLERSGVKFGADLNAYTSFDETVYKLPLPTNDPKLWENGMQIMRDWAADATIEAGEFDKERGVIQEERRQRLNATSRLSERYQPVLFNHSRYAERMPIGLDSVILHANVSLAKNFYKRWYRPDLQAIIIVGDIQVDKVESQIIRLFSDLKAPEKVVHRTRSKVPLHNLTGFLKLSDPEFTQYSIQFFYKQLNQPLQTTLDFKRELTERLANMLLINRLTEKSYVGKPSYLAARAEVGPLIANMDAMRLSVSLDPQMVEKGFAEFWSAVEQVKRFGFLPEELRLGKDKMDRSMEIAKSESGKTSSVSYADTYLQFFLNGDVYLDLSQRDALYHRYIDQISAKDVNDFIGRYLSSPDQMILVIGPESTVDKLPDSVLINDWMAKVKAEQLKPYQLVRTTQSLIKQLPKAGKIVKEENNAALGIYHWQLDNGMNIFAKPTDFKNDQVLISGFSKGGTSLYASDDFYSAKYATSFIVSSGLGELNAGQLSQFLNTRAVQLQPYISERTEGFSGVSASKDLPVAMEMMYLYMMPPKLDTARFNRIISQSKMAFKHRTSDPNRDFSDTVAYVLSDYHERRKPASSEDFEKIDSVKVKSIFNERFSNPADFNFVFTGNFNIDSLKRWSERYLGALSPKGKPEIARDWNIRVPQGQFRKDLRVGKSHKATVQLVLSGIYEYSKQNDLYLDLLKETLQLRLISRLRESEAGVYSPRVDLTIAKQPINFYAFTISFNCDPARLEQLLNATKEEISILAKSGVTPEELEKFIAEQNRSHELMLHNNQYWLTRIQDKITDEMPFEDIENDFGALQKLSADQSIQYSKRFLNQNNEIVFTLGPL